MFKTLLSSALFLLLAGRAFALSFDGGQAASGAQAGDIVCTDCVNGTDIADTITLDDPLTVSGSSVTISSHVLISGALTQGGGEATYSVDTAVTLTGGLNGLNFDSNTLSIDAASNRVGIGTNAPATSLEVAGGSITVSGSGAGVMVGTNRVGMVEMQTETNNILVQVASAAVTGSLAIDFTNAGLKDYAAAPFVILSPLFDAASTTVLSCNYHTVSTTGMTIECNLITDSGAGTTDVAADGSARQVNYLLSGTAP